jgi:hypothetical protein
MKIPAAVRPRTTAAKEMTRWSSSTGPRLRTISNRVVASSPARRHLQTGCSAAGVSAMTAAARASFWDACSSPSAVMTRARRSSST